MKHRTILYISGQAGSAGTSSELAERLRLAVEDRGDVLVGTFVADDADGRRRQSKSGWKALLGSLDSADQVAMVSAGDLPGRTVNDLLRLLGTLRDHGVGLFLVTENIDTASGSAAILDLIAAYRAAKLSQAIRRGQDRARAAGKSIGRPAIPMSIRRRIAADLASDAPISIRQTAKKFGVSPASVVTIRRTMAETVAQAA